MLGLVTISWDANAAIKAGVVLARIPSRIEAVFSVHSLQLEVGKWLMISIM